MFVNKVTQIPALDGLRAVAVLSVIIAHFPFVQGVALSVVLTNLCRELRLSTIGVDVFFVLSGFLITRILISEKLETGRINIARFYLKRSIRIFPIYFLCLFFSAIFFRFSETEILSLSTYTFNFYHPFNPAPHAMEHTWSLAVEEQFYLVWPFLISALPIRYGRFVTALIVPGTAVAAAVVFALAFKGSLADDLIYMTSATRMLSLSAGACLAFCEIERMTFTARRCTAGLAAGAGILVTASLARSFGVIPPSGLYWVAAIVGFSLVSVSALAAIVFRAGPRINVAKRMLEVPALRYVGKISYGLYLYHYPVLFALGLNAAAVDGHGVAIGRWAEGIGLTVALAVLSFHFIEAPLLKLRSRLGANGLGAGRVVQAFNFVDHEGEDPGEKEDADDHEPEIVEVIVQSTDDVPEATFQLQLVTDQSEGFDTADEHGYDDRNQCDRHVVVKFPHRLDEGPIIGAEHHDAVSGVDQRHAGSKQHREDHDRLDRNALGHLCR